MANNSGEVLLADFIDLAKAFNIVNYSILFKKLSGLGFSGRFHNLICSYLENIGVNLRV